MFGESPVANLREGIWWAAGVGASPNPSPMKVFVSHSAFDKGLARSLAEDLRINGVEPWLDELELRAGTALQHVEQAVREADALVVVHSQHAAASVWVEREVTLAVTARVPVFPVIIDDTPLASNLASLSHVDMRRPREYRRAFYRLLAALTGRRNPLYLTAKQALRLLRQDLIPAGELVGMGQLGLHFPIVSAHRHQWDFADTGTGASRWWLIEYRDGNTLTTWPVSDGRVGAPLEHEIVKAGEKPPTAKAQSLLTLVNEFDVPENRSPSGMGSWVPGPVTPLRPDFRDSDEAVEAGLEQRRSRHELGRDQIVLTRIRHEALGIDQPLWTIAIVDATAEVAAESVGVDASGLSVVVSFVGESLVSHGLRGQGNDDGPLTLDVLGHLRVTEQFWRLRDESTRGLERITGTEALDEVERFLRREADSRWRSPLVAALSNTGVLQAKQTSAMLRSADEALMDPTGRARQWVVELILTDEAEVQRRVHEGVVELGYPYRKFMVTERGHLQAQPPEGTGLMPFRFAVEDRRTIPETARAYEAAVLAAFRMAPADFHWFSASLVRLKSGQFWYFRFYDRADIVRKVTVTDDDARDVREGSPF